MHPFEQTWAHTPMDIKVHELAREYHKKAEAYDRTVCTGPIVHGEIQPASSAELRLINRHGQRLKAQILHENPDVDHRALHKEIVRLS